MSASSRPRRRRLAVARDDVHVVNEFINVPAIDKLIEYSKTAHYELSRELLQGYWYPRLRGVSLIQDSKDSALHSGVGMSKEKGWNIFQGSCLLFLLLLLFLLFIPLRISSRKPISRLFAHSPTPLVTSTWCSSRLSR